MAICALGLLAGCVAGPNAGAGNTAASGGASRATSALDCTKAAGNSAACYFRNSPVQLLAQGQRFAGSKNDYFPIARPLEFVDAAGQTWTAPRGTMTDGASIPQIFISTIGDPRTPEFVNAAAVHDAYCGLGNEAGEVYQSRPWQEVHRTFYEALIVGGTNEVKAKVMFAAVWLGGPRWYMDEPRLPALAQGNQITRSTKGHMPVKRRQDTRHEQLPLALRINALREARFYIEQSNPDILTLMRFLNEQESRIFRQAFGSDQPAPEQETGGDDRDRPTEDPPQYL